MRKLFFFTFLFVRILTFANDISFISAVDISSYLEIELSEPTFFKESGEPEDFLMILKENGVNTIRLRLWVNPQNEHSGFEEVKDFSTRLRKYGFTIWLSIHYSDSWADPGKQEIPAEWQGKSFPELKNHVQNYTRLIAEEIKPEYIQIGNEINSGFLHPNGKLSTNTEQFKELLKTAIQAVRIYSPNAKIILHYAGIDSAEWFFNQVNSLDYDIIGISFYPLWHGKNLVLLEEKLNLLSNSYHKEIVIAETAYPFTLAWNDMTNNIVGMEEQLILPDFPATKKGQKDFVRQIKTIIKRVENGVGFCYWGAELISWKGAKATDASPWENQALFDFENKVLPALEEFKN
jgi:arabinogalactan endo-1,4-beta-galactosidase